MLIITGLEPFPPPPQKLSTSQKVSKTVGMTFGQKGSSVSSGEKRSKSSGSTESTSRKTVGSPFGQKGSSVSSGEKGSKSSGSTESTIRKTVGSPFGQKGSSVSSDEKGSKSSGSTESKIIEKTTSSCTSSHSDTFKVMETSREYISCINIVLCAVD